VRDEIASLFAFVSLLILTAIPCVAATTAGALVIANALDLGDGPAIILGSLAGVLGAGSAIVVTSIVVSLRG
jgi:hypothetical protein